jgi:hypothetical protein
LAEIAADPFVSFTAVTRRNCIQTCWRWVFRQKTPTKAGRSFEPFPNHVVRSLLRAAEGDLVKSWNSGAITKHELRKVESLDLSGCVSVVDLSALALVPKLRRLLLRDCIAVKAFEPINSLKCLEVLNLEGCQVGAQLTPFTKLENLKALILGEKIDMALLSSSKHLRELHLHFPKTAECDLTPLAELENLDYLCARVNDDTDIMLSKQYRDDPKLIKSKGLLSLLERRVVGQPRRRRGSM